MKEKSILGDFLKQKEKNFKNLLKYENVKVNGKIVTSFHYELKKDDQILINTIKNERNHHLDIIYEDHEFIVLNKPQGLLTIATDNEREKTLYHMVRSYVNQKNQKLFCLHRLDRETSGIVVFTKKESLKNQLQRDWNHFVLKRKYIALVEGKLKNQSGTLVHSLDDSKEFVRISNHGKKSITTYKVVKQNQNRSLVDIDLKTGRRNQIRVQFSFIGHPIIGDQKYHGMKSKTFYLCAYEIVLMHPKSKKIYNFKIDIPKEFYQ